MATIRKRGHKWQVQVRRKGVSSFSQSFHNRKDAEEWARHMEVQADRRDLPADVKVLQEFTLGDLVSKYRETVTAKKKGAATESVVLSRFLRHPICCRPLSELRTADFAAYRDERLAEISPVSLKRQLNPIRHLFSVAKNEWRLPIKENPLDGLKLKVVDQRRERRLRTGELDRLLQAAKRCRNRFVYPIVLLALETAMRRSEILALRGTDIDFNSRLLLIRDSKNGHGRTIPLTKAALSLLASLRLTERELFPITANAFRLAWERLTRRAGIEDLHFHDLRHEAISRLFEQRLTVPEVAVFSGHRDMRMLFRYAHAMHEQILAKLESVAAPS